MFSSCRHRENVGLGGEEWAFASTDEMAPAAAWQHHHHHQQQQQQPRVMVHDQATTSALYYEVSITTKIDI